MPEKTPTMECPFCGIASGKIPTTIIYQDGICTAFLDINPRNPGHVLVIPKKHQETIFDVSDKEASEMFLTVKKVASAVKDGTKADGVSISQSNGRAAGQLVPHMAFHVIPRFNAEGPIALEGVLPVKKLPKEANDKIAESIKTALASPSKTSKAEKLIEGSDDDSEEEVEFDF